jgi:putative ABC transport system permease protein
MKLLRPLLRTPTFTYPVIAGLAIAIGATTAVFSVFSAMLLRPLGLRDPQRVVALWRTDPAHGQKSVEVSYRDYAEWRKATDAVEDVALASSVNLDFPLLVNGEPEHVEGTTVTGNFFRVLGATPIVGRLLKDEDDRPGAPANAVLSHSLWQSRFGSDPGVVGRQVRLGSDSWTVVGVARPEFDFPQDVAVWVPLGVAWPNVEKSGGIQVFRSLARLQQGVPASRARARLDAITRQFETGATASGNWPRVLATPMLDEIYGAAHPAVWILLGAVFLVLLIACANAANLLLNRAAERRHELAVRAALGAGRRRLVGLLVVEAAVLAAAAGALGLLLASGGVEALTRIAPDDVPRIGQAKVDWLVMGFGTALTFATVLLFGVGPAVLASRRDPAESLREGGRGSSGSARQATLRRLLIAGEGALAAILLAGAGTLIHSFAKLSAIDPGFRAERVLTFRVTTERPTQEARRALYTEVLERVRSLPGVESAGAVLIRPLSGTVGWDTNYEIEGQPPERREANPNGNYEAISPDYFRTMGIQMLAGRDFTSADTEKSPGVVIVDEATSRRHWRGDAVGKRIRLGGNAKAPWLTIVGVVRQARYRQWEAAWPDLYVPYTQRAQHRTDFVVKTAGDPWKLAGAVRREVFGADRNQPISNVTTMEALVDRALARSKFNGVAMAALASCALLLAAIGIYGVLSYAVTQRSGEIAVRVSLGATPARIAKMVAGDGVRPVLAGLAVGLAVAFGLRRLLGALLYGVEDADAWAFGGAALVLAAVAALACVEPAARAARTDPARALRSE